ncbi:MAG: hypothetical protein WC284_18175 [Candidimonas sp.]
MSSSIDYENQPLSAEVIEQMGKLGIKRVAVDHFYVGEYRYTHLKDAIAEAERRLMP